MFGIIGFIMWTASVHLASRWYERSRIRGEVCKDCSKQLRWFTIP